MNTFLSSAQQAQCEAYDKAVREILAPVAEKLVRQEADLKEFLQRLAQHGFLGINVPKEYGGQGGTLLDLALLSECIGRRDAGVCLSLAEHAAVIELIKSYGSDQLKSRYLPSLARGEGFGTTTFAEETAGTDFQNVGTTEKGGLINGEKTSTVNGDFATLMALTAKSNDEFALYLVERQSAAAPAVVKQRHLMGMQSAHVVDLQFAACAVAEENRLASGKQAAEAVIYAMSVAKTLLSAAALGLLETATHLAVDHAKTRQQFGATLSTFQGVQWKLADMGIDTAAARLQVYRAAWSHDEDRAQFTKYAAMCKLLAGQAARLHSGEALQIMGAAGLLADSLIARFYDDAKVMEIAEGTSEHQKMLLVHELNI